MLTDETQALHIHAADNVAVAITPLQKGDRVTVDGREITIQDDIPAGHKFLLADLKKDAWVVKYGSPIGHLKMNKDEGEWVDDRHIATNLSGLLEYSYQPVEEIKPSACCEDPTLPSAFMGYRRRNGEAGIRNEIWIVPTVGCVNGVAQQLCQQLKAELPSDRRVVAFPHNYGCSQLSEDHENTRKILRNLVLHPNAGAVLVVGLGCENNQPREFEKLLGDYDRERIRFMVCQEVEGNELEEGMKILRELVAIVQHDSRESIPLSELRIGLKCGGSDGFSGITANPLLGVFSDYLTAQGGTTVLTEVPEMFGAETLLMNRCADEQLFRKTVHLINNFKDYYLSHGEPVGENPSPGNKAGGISTLEEKALGCTQKGGTSLVRGVLDYGERLQSNGLQLLSAPGNDLVASTALAASGCHLVLFTTGRGTPFGTFVPTMKVSTNSTLAQRKPQWIDFNAGTLLTGESMDCLFRRFMAQVVEHASGRPTRNEQNNYQEIAIFKTGVTL